MTIESEPSPAPVSADAQGGRMLPVLAPRAAEARRPPDGPAPAAAQLTFAGPLRRKRRRVSMGQAGRSGLEALGSNLGRALLTALGVIIGVGAVVIMVSIGQAASAEITSTLAALGTNVLIISPGTTVSGENSTAVRLTEADAGAIAKLTGVAAASPVVTGGVQATYNRRSWTTRVQGAYPAIQQIQNFVVAQGGFFTAEDDAGARPVCVLGMTVVRALFDGDDPVGQQIRIRDLTCSVVGVLAPRGTTGLVDQDDLILLPFHTAVGRLFGQLASLTIVVQGTSPQALSDVQIEATQYLRTQHRLLPGAADDFSIRSNNQVQDALRKTTGALTVLLAGIAAVSLVVGGIGIMNIMFVSVTERTREIGTRMAVGARRGDVLAQFLLEAILISGGGGVVGLVFGAVMSLTITGAAGWGASVNGNGMLLAFAFSVAVGVFFGYYPARKASRLDPIEALRRD